MHVSDLLKGIIKFKNNVVKGVTIYNIGVETETSVSRIADIVCEKMALNNVTYQYTGGKIGWKGDVSTFKYDLSKVHSAGWHAEMTSEEAVMRTVCEVLSCRR
jgi:UDP-glucose 4-epimerase